MLFQQGAVTAEDYLGQARSDVDRRPPAPELDGRVPRAPRSRADARRRAMPRPPAHADAHFQLGAAYGYQATYAATIEGSLFGSLRAARRAYAEHQRVLELDPDRKDAGLIVGMYRYAVSSLSLPSRLMAHLAGFGGGRDRGLRHGRGGRQLPERRADQCALHADRHLQPRGAIRRRAARDRASCSGSTRAIGCCGSRPAARRSGPVVRPSRASRSSTGSPMLADDPRPRAFGELARWGYYHGAALVALKESTPRGARSTRRSGIRRGPGCRAASTPSSASSPTSPAIARGASRSIARRSVSAAVATTMACVEGRADAR